MYHKRNTITVLAEDHNFVFFYPLQTFVLTVTIFREAVDDIRRHQRDKEVNGQKYRRLVRGRETSELVPSSKLHVGDLVSVYELGTCNAANVTRALLPRNSESTGKCESLVLICSSAYFISYNFFKCSKFLVDAGVPCILATVLRDAIKWALSYGH